MATTVARRGRLEQRLRREPGRLGLVPYLMAGHPDAAATFDIALRLADLGVTALELGIPCPEPRWDGPVITEAGRQALEQGTTVARSLDLAAAIALGTDVPVVLMTYGGPLLAYGSARFALDAAAAGVAGVIVPDLVDGRRASVTACLRAAGLDAASVVAPTSPSPEVAEACRASTGFVYCALAASTGARASLGQDVPSHLARVRSHTSLPLVAGFGISRPEHLAGLRGHADAAVVGSALVAEVAAGRDPVPFVKALLAACP
jgi:tryptophan synthase alpha chain